MLLYAGAQLGNTKPLAKWLIKPFKSLSAGLRANPDDFYPIRVMSDATIGRVKISEAADVQISHYATRKSQF